MGLFLEGTFSVGLKIWKKDFDLKGNKMIKKHIEDSVVLKNLEKIGKDGMSVFVMADGLYRGALINGTELINQMRVQQETGILETLVLGQGLLSCALMITTLKEKGRISLSYETDGACKGFLVNGDSSGYVNGCLLDGGIPVEKPLENWDLAPYFGNGIIKVTKSYVGTAEPLTGIVELKYKSIAENISWYYLQSEQVNTAFNTSIMFDKDGRVTGAGGLFLQEMPRTGGVLGGKYTEQEVGEIRLMAENAFRAAPSLGQWFSEGGNRDDIIYGLFREFAPSVVYERNIVFDCDCSNLYYKRILSRLPEGDLLELGKDDDPLEVKCNKCGSVYRIFKNEIIK